MGLDELPSQIASDVDAAIQSEVGNMQSEMHEAEIDLEKARLKSEERMNDRNAERDENVASAYSGMDEMRSMVNSMLGRIDALLNYASSNVPSPSVIHNEIAPEENDDDEDDDESEIENPVASEDIPSESPEVLTTAENIENEIEHPVEAVEKTESEVENGSPIRRGRKRRRNR